MSDFDQRNHDFCKALVDAQFAYIEAEKRVSELQDENAKIRKKARELWHGHDCGGGCVYFDRCNHPIKDECPMIDSLRELGIEVGE